MKVNNAIGFQSVSGLFLVQNRRGVLHLQKTVSVPVSCFNYFPNLFLFTVTLLQKKTRVNVLNPLTHLRQ